MYLEENVQNKKKYYYLVKSIRIGKNKWKKIRTYLGTTKPSKDQIKEVSNVKYLSPEQVKILEHICKNYLAYYTKATKVDLENFEESVLTEFTYNTTAIEGSTLSPEETEYLLKDKRTPAGKDLREIYGAINIKEAYNCMKSIQDISHDSIKKIHEIVMKNILENELGEYRTVPVRIGVARHRPPLPIDVKPEMNALVEWYNNNKHKIHPFELACLFHIKFEGIHPFRDGNGRVGRLLMNFILTRNKYPLLDIKVAKRVDYYKTLDTAHVSKRIKPFIDYAFETYVEDAERMDWTGEDQNVLEMLKKEIERIKKFFSVPV